jgi:predicted metalloendopeptidase
MRLPLIAALLASPMLAGTNASLSGDLIEANRDQAVPARQDFWRHANGRWNQAHPILADRAVYNSFAWQDDLLKRDLLAINADLLVQKDANGDQRRQRGLIGAKQGR